MEAESATSVSQDSFWESAEVPDATELPPDDSTEILNAPTNTCPTCGEEVVREPGKRGRVPKYHPECRPSARRTSVTGTGRMVRANKKEQEAAEQVELMIEQCRRGIAKMVFILSIADPYCAFVIHVNTPEILDNLRPVLMKFEWLRRQANNASTGAAVLGLILSIFTTILPIAAHHGLVPGKKVALILMNMPIFLHRLQVRVAEQDPEALTTELLSRVHEERRAQQRSSETTEVPPSGQI
jgi:hypothetical protein